jgi:glutamate synthase domain-containing protein 2
MAQGSKPGEGGHIPGHKVNGEIARRRGSHFCTALFLREQRVSRGSEANSSDRK